MSLATDCTSRKPEYVCAKLICDSLPPPVAFVALVRQYHTTHFDVVFMSRVVQLEQLQEQISADERAAAAAPLDTLYDAVASKAAKTSTKHEPQQSSQAEGRSPAARRASAKERKDGGAKKQPAAPIRRKEVPPLASTAPAGVLPTMHTCVACAALTSKQRAITC